MIQDIEPQHLYNEWEKCEPGPDSRICVFRGGKLAILADAPGSDTATAPGSTAQAAAAPGSAQKAGVLEVDQVTFPRLKDFAEPPACEYLFRIDDVRYFLAPDETPVPEGFEFAALMGLREMRPNGGAGMFAACTAYHLWKWYSANRYCGACGHPTAPDDKERALVCPACGNHIYPRLNPAVIVGVINGGNLLVTKYRVGYGHSALVAGFTEIGETFEQTVAREVREETGLAVKNIRYYKSQPWGPAEDILAGYYCEVDGDDTIRMDTSELKYAEWVKREDLVLQPSEYSLTNEMMMKFRDEGILL